MKDIIISTPFTAGSTEELGEWTNKLCTVGRGGERKDRKSLQRETLLDNTDGTWAGKWRARTL